EQLHRLLGRYSRRDQKAKEARDRLWDVAAAFGIWTRHPAAYGALIDHNQTRGLGLIETEGVKGGAEFEMSHRRQAAVKSSAPASSLSASTSHTPCGRSLICLASIMASSRVKVRPSK